ARSRAGQARTRPIRTQQERVTLVGSQSDDRILTRAAGEIDVAVTVVPAEEVIAATAEEGRIPRTGDEDVVAVPGKHTRAVAAAGLDEVVAVPELDEVRPVFTRHRVRAVPGDHQVVAVPGGDVIIALTQGDRIAPTPGRDRVIAVARVQG